MALGPEWALLLSHSDEFFVLARQALLDGEGIQCIILNKKDSNYAFGEVELHVRKEDFIKARYILDNPTG